MTLVFYLGCVLLTVCLQSCKLDVELVGLIIACNQSAQRKRDVARFVYAYVSWLFFWLRFWSTSALYGHCILSLLFLFLLLFVLFSLLLLLSMNALYGHCICRRCCVCCFAFGMIVLCFVLFAFRIFPRTEMF